MFINDLNSPPTSLAEQLEKMHLSSSSSAIGYPQQQQQQQSCSPTTSSGNYTPLLQKVPEESQQQQEELQKDEKLYLVEFKAGRTDFFYYVEDDALSVGDLVIVEADRGKDLGKIAMVHLTPEQVSLLQQSQRKQDNNEGGCGGGGGGENGIKRIYRLAAPDEIDQLAVKGQDEERALAVCQQKIKQRKLRMDVVDAEYQWYDHMRDIVISMHPSICMYVCVCRDRRKLTFYFIAERRIDFRELVRELFKIYKTRIWMQVFFSTFTLYEFTHVVILF